MKLIPSKMILAYRSGGSLLPTASWATLDATHVIDAKLIGEKFVQVEADLQSSIDGVAGDLAAYETSNDAALAAEIAQTDADFASAATARQAIQDDVDANELAAANATAAVASDLADYETSNDAALAAEIAQTDADFASAATARQAIQDDVDANELAAANATAAVASDLADYETSNDAALAAEIAQTDSDFAAAASERTVLDGKISAETVRAQGAEAALSTAISDEETRATGAEAALSTAISDEETRATTAEAALSGRLDVIEGDSTTEGSIAKAIADLTGAAPEALDTLSELGDALGDDANFAATLTNTLSTMRSELDAIDAADAEDLDDEIARAQARENTLEAAILVNANAVATLETNVNNTIDALDVNGFIKEDDFVNLKGLVGAVSAVTISDSDASVFSIAVADSVVSGTMKVSVNGVMVNDASGFATGIQLPFILEADDYIAISYTIAGA